MTRGSRASRAPVFIPDESLEEMRRKLLDRRVTAQGGEPDPWAMGCDLQLLDQVCDHWSTEFDWRSTERRLNQLGPVEFAGVHAFRPSPGGMPVLLLHGWPSTPLEYLPAAELLGDRGFDPIVPSLPGFAFSEDAGPETNVVAITARLRALLEEGLGLREFAIAGGDWGAVIGARLAFEMKDATVGFYVSTPATLPGPGNVEVPELDQEEIEYAQRARDWLRRDGHHMVVQASVPDAVSIALSDSPAGLCGYLLEKYRRWGDTGGDPTTRFDLDTLCEWLTAQWATGSVSSAMRLYRAERLNRWRLGPSERIDVPAAVSCWAGEPLHPPRRWVERVLPDIRRWSVAEGGGHFAAFEEPDAYVSDLEGFLGSL